MKIRSTAFVDGGVLPRRYTADEDNYSPPLTFEDVPARARSLALIVEDRDAGAAPVPHWVVFNIDALVGGFAQAEMAGRYRDGKNGLGGIGYSGPRTRDEHRYAFCLYAVDIPLDLPNGVEIGELRRAMEGHVLAQAETTARYACTAPLPDRTSPKVYQAPGQHAADLVRA